ncbi:bifunctional folylpolyglutamate synthase/dihydrofolate synthase [Lysinibacillus capsici]|uniref:bifunctional folylpolyglutamate synthase/dihydrofolate synthase n=1 Tax=Lysinibacillus capsici TaxID=2115968 RepID=UPI0001DA55D8|nr:folylpolyglutamate synthase/dihydrofolate synthase family protein [Lysinibacillus capsici]EFI69382.1 folylpolyglutamate synthase [Lysinibacillus fusiformis ZC1]EKU41493.1 folylpolyglutamate synthase [Lysinibacillus fusiformis ZB2]MBU5252068.1 bifunctional folylpolyglutamate synthase/dihydrofolate synthase [Lysinibacillus capsici]MED4699074.1 bifunctional folylpolyglutamate synthase/dihydrofolate synthase [Lysinibacillus capsici]
MIPSFDHYKEKWQVKSDDIIKPGLTAIEEALSYLGNPEQTLRVVHLAGTNGKGSTLTFLEAIAQEHGLRVGKFMSPCIVDVHDQIQIAGQPITEAEMDQVFQQMHEAGLSGKLTDFELLTVAAFLHFVNGQVDIALIEAGMGGLLDSTNVVIPIVSIIPSIALEHTKFLGDTLESIAHHKAGIIKQQRPVIIGDLPGEAKRVVDAVANQKKATLFSLGKHFSIKPTTDGESYINDVQQIQIANLKRTMKGAHQGKNMALAITAFFEVASVLGVSIDQTAIRQAVQKASILGRFEEIMPFVILDGAHNPASAEKLVETIQCEYPNEHITFVVGILADKDVQQILGLLEQVSDDFYFVDFANSRAMPAHQMVKLSHATSKTTLVDYASFIQAQSHRQQRTIVSGSLYLLTEVRHRLKQ